MTAPATDAAVQTTPRNRTFLGHPPGLGYLAFTEAWERFSFYGMQSLLVLYMVKSLLLPGHVENVALFEQFRQLYGGVDGQALASAIFGTYAASVYVTPILGGWLADRVLGKRRTVLLGAVTMALGHFLMAFETSFLFALLCLVLGSGMFKGNLASQVGALYGPRDLRRADAFQIFYLGINAGVIASPLVVGTLGEVYGWHYGFGAAGIGMLVGLTIYVSGQKYLPKEHLKPQNRVSGIKAPRLQAGEWPTVIALLVLVPVLAIAIIPNNQIFNAYLAWGDAQFDLYWAGQKLPTTWLVTLDSIVSVSFLAIVAAFYRWYGKHWREPDEVGKIIIGSVFSVGGMLCLYMAAATQAPGEKIGLAWPVTFHIVNSIGFAHIFPVSLALFAKAAPKAINSMMLGIYYLAFFIGNALVGWVGGFYETMPTTTFWLMHAGFALFSGLCFVAFRLFAVHHLNVQESPKH
ncbi:MAG: peptide MFS transporter [Lysobacterales bacterium]|jgi:POT family proton-dependent oligopeptide transporter